MNESEYQALLQTAGRRPLQAEEQARMELWLAAHPEAQAEWEIEAGLNRLLEQLPDAPVASNFTARVVQALDQKPSGKTARASLSAWLGRWFRRPAPRIAWALLLLGAALF